MSQAHFSPAAPREADQVLITAQVDRFLGAQGRVVHGAVESLQSLAAGSLPGYGRQETLVWLADLSGDEGAAVARRMLDRISRKQDGTMAAANTANRKRMVLGNAMEYACEIGELPSNPLKRVKWTKPRTLRTVDPDVVRPR